ncbi:hypothetical protein GDO81_019419 [Engystomops pustulosus]|uniref:Uncharacterized protein n=1 Tax=Engystomops pustulosus TaxID=76066 RepID=A0AAV6ZFW5_ENGPU|nr:hypothetical protein GDO81_019419 [Engystomops pustulosus]
MSRTRRAQNPGRTISLAGHHRKLSNLVHHQRAAQHRQLWRFNLSTSHMKTATTSSRRSSEPELLSSCLGYITIISLCSVWEVP